MLFDVSLSSAWPTPIFLRLNSSPMKIKKSGANPQEWAWRREPGFTAVRCLPGAHGGHAVLRLDRNNLTGRPAQGHTKTVMRGDKTRTPSDKTKARYRVPNTPLPQLTLSDCGFFINHSVSDSSHATSFLFI